MVDFCFQSRGLTYTILFYFVGCTMKIKTCKSGMQKGRNTVFSVQILANLVMETLHSDLRDTIGPRLKGKMHQKQKSWMLVSSWRQAPGSGGNRTKLSSLSGSFCRFPMRCTDRCCVTPPGNIGRWWKHVKPRESRWTPGCELTWTRLLPPKSTSPTR